MVKLRYIERILEKMQCVVLDCYWLGIIKEDRPGDTQAPTRPDRY